MVRRGHPISNTLKDEMITGGATEAYRELTKGQLGSSYAQRVVNSRDTHSLPLCFRHQILRGIMTVIATQMRVFEELEIKHILNEKDEG